MRRVVTVVLTILFIVIPCLAIESNSFFTLGIILWPIVAVALAFWKVYNYDKINYKKANERLIARKFENSEEDNIKETVKNLKITNKATDGMEEK